jgi:hypothetical protein
MSGSRAHVVVEVAPAPDVHKCQDFLSAESRGEHLCELPCTYMTSISQLVEHRSPNTPWICIASCG